MARKFWGLSLVVAAISSLMGAPVASAASVPVVEVVSIQGTTWVETTVDEAVSSLEVKILAPRANGTRSVWQTCRFGGDTPGTYRCGIDSSKGSLARQRVGTWVAKVFAGDTRVGRVIFSL